MFFVSIYGCCMMNDLIRSIMKTFDVNQLWPDLFKNLPNGFHHHSSLLKMIEELSMNETHRAKDF